MVGVSMGRYPKVRKTSSMMLKMYFRRATWPGKKSLVPLGNDGFDDIYLGNFGNAGSQKMRPAAKIVNKYNFSFHNIFLPIW